MTIEIRYIRLSCLCDRIVTYCCPLKIIFHTRFVITICTVSECWW